MCNFEASTPEELMSHLKEVHGIEVNPDITNNLMKGMSEVFGKMLSGKTEMSSDEEGDKAPDPTLLFGNMMGQLFKVLAKGMKGLTKDMDGLKGDSSVRNVQDMPDPFKNMMKNIFSQSFSIEPEPETKLESDIPPPSTNEKDVSFQENSIEIPISTDDDKQKKDKKEDS